MLSSTEAALLAKMGDRGQLGNVVIDGPLSLDVALYKEAAEIKKVKGSSVAGDADCLLFPNIESGNVFFKASTHMGGGISVSAHCKGRVIDTNNALDGDGPIAPERAGTVPAGALVNLCFSGKYSQRDVLKMLAGKGGLVAHLNQNSVQQICIDIEKGDQKSKAVLDAMSYSIAKEIGAMAAVLKGQVDAILLTGGVAYNEPVNDVIREHCSFLAPIFIYPGEDEMGALMLNALSVLRGERTPKVYA